MPTYRLDLEYLGTRYHGWQEQKNARSVAGELRAAIEGAGQHVVELVGSGRTDSGVHALRQTAHLRLSARVDAEGLRREVNDRLPHDVHVLALDLAADAFHARHSAVARSYLYQVSRRRSGLAKRGVWWVRETVDLERMATAAATIVGRHDFARFCERPAEQGSTLVVVSEAEVQAAGDLVLVRLVASHFLWKMVRRLVGTLVRVGTGELDGAAFARLLAAGAEAPNFEPARHTAPASGLFLERVLYPGEPPLPPLGPAQPVSSAELAGGMLFLGRSAEPGRRGKPGPGAPPGRSRGRVERMRRRAADRRRRTSATGEAGR